MRGVSKRFGDTIAVHDLDLDLASGESLVILGPSGSRKSTLLRILAGLETPDTGEIRIADVLQTAYHRTAGTSRSCFSTSRCTPICPP
ncbi:hypothetical protein MLGJGCBP_06747 [Rhodococcus sp. T7]|nr:hypothetical protein MLGJGCBP_09841 [Rhodococcus sp. T7]KAF0960168.1 hypothetical protein MLGJGCBP_06747 [Rhodococcus sp. T7]